MESSTVPYALAVDDDFLVLMHVSAILTDVGFRPIEAGNADEALQALTNLGDSIALLFSDVEMPGSMDGFALARQAAERWPELSIVIASGRRIPEDGAMPPRATFIPKPFDDKTVKEHLAKVLPDGKKPAPLKRPV